MACTRDLSRNVWHLFGLPVDNLTMEAAKALIRERANHKTSLVLSTINVNWVVQSPTDPSFRQAIINSDIVTIDGKPLLWYVKLLGYPMLETVPGSCLIQELIYEKGCTCPLTIFYFGGEDGIAEKAMQKNKQQ